jgi:hypothetical protein
VPLAKYFPHEIGEFDKALPVRHKTSLLGSVSDDSNLAIYSELAPPKFLHEKAPVEDDDGGIEEAPLLPHERAVSHIRIDDMAARPGRASSSAWTSALSESSVNRRAGGIWRSRTSISSTLPHKLPRSDAEDANLRDPSLEAFPTSRERILERVATIGSHLPEDDAPQSPTHTHSPAVLSQACSSVDLAPIGSHTSLHCIAEEALAETEEDAMSVESPAMELTVYAAPRDDRHSASPADDNNSGQAATTSRIQNTNDGQYEDAITPFDGAVGALAESVNNVKPMTDFAAIRERAAAAVVQQPQAPRPPRVRPIRQVPDLETARPAVQVPQPRWYVRAWNCVKELAS